MAGFAELKLYDFNAFNSTKGLFIRLTFVPNNDNSDVQLKIAA